MDEKKCNDCPKFETLANGWKCCMGNSCEIAVRADERRKFAEWLSNHQNIYIIDGYMWKKCVEVVDCKVTLEDVLAEYEKEQKGETK